MLAEEQPDGVLLCAHYDRLDDLSACELGVVQAIALTLSERLVSSQPLRFLPETADLSHWDGSAYHNPLDLYSDTDTTHLPTFRSALTGEMVTSPAEGVERTLKSTERRRTEETRIVEFPTRCRIHDDEGRRCPNIVQNPTRQRRYVSDRTQWDLWISDPGQNKEVECDEHR